MMSECTILLTHKCNDFSWWFFPELQFWLVVSHKPLLFLSFRNWCWAISWEFISLSRPVASLGYSISWPPDSCKLFNEQKYTLIYFSDLIFSHSSKILFSLNHLLLNFPIIPSSLLFNEENIIMHFYIYM